MVVGRAIVRDLFSGAEAQRLMSHVTLVFAVAPAVAPIIGGRLQVWWGWRSVFVFLVLFGGVAWSLCRWLLPETLPQERRRPIHAGSLARSYWEVLRAPAFVAVCLAATLNFSGMFIYIVSAPVYMMQHMKVSETGFIWLFGPVTVGMALGAYLSNRSAGRASALQTIGWAYVLMVAASAINLGINLLGQPLLPWAVMPLFIYVLGMSLAFPSLTLLALDLFPAQRGLAASCQSFVQTTGAAVNAILAPRFWGSVKHLAAYQSTTLVLGLATYGFFLWVSQREAKATTATALSVA
jgi:DHA1 family bicyclomycin/chloramphenicol resistance-like MFS transporter